MIKNNFFDDTKLAKCLLVELEKCFLLSSSERAFEIELKSLL